MSCARKLLKTKKRGNFSKKKGLDKSNHREKKREEPCDGAIRLGLDRASRDQIANVAESPAIPPVSGRSVLLLGFIIVLSYPTNSLT